MRAQRPPRWAYRGGAAERGRAASRPRAWHGDVWRRRSARWGCAPPRCGAERCRVQRRSPPSGAGGRRGGRGGRARPSCSSAARARHGRLAAAPSAVGRAPLRDVARSIGACSVPLLPPALAGAAGGRGANHSDGGASGPRPAGAPPIRLFAVYIAPLSIAWYCVACVFDAHGRCSTRGVRRTVSARRRCSQRGASVAASYLGGTRRPLRPTFAYVAIYVLASCAIYLSLVFCMCIRSLCASRWAVSVVGTSGLISSRTRSKVRGPGPARCVCAAQVSAVASSQWSLSERLQSVRSLLSHRKLSIPMSTIAVRACCLGAHACRLGTSTRERQPAMRRAKHLHRCSRIASFQFLCYPMSAIAVCKPVASAHTRVASAQARATSARHAAG